MTCVFDIASGALAPLADGIYGVLYSGVFAMKAVAWHSEAIEFERNPSLSHIRILIDAYADGWQGYALTPSLVCGWHRDLFPAGGYYRTCAAYFSGSEHGTAPPEQIPGAILTLCYDISWLLDQVRAGRMDAMFALATVHHRFECIHPFSDGNGRVGRVLLQYMAGALHSPAICLKAADRNEYVAILERGDVHALAALFERSKFKQEEQQYAYSTR